MKFYKKCPQSPRVPPLKTLSGSTPGCQWREVAAPNGVRWRKGQSSAFHVIPPMQMAEGQTKSICEPLRCMSSMFHLLRSGRFLAFAPFYTKRQRRLGLASFSRMSAHSLPHEEQRKTAAVSYLTTMDQHLPPIHTAGARLLPPMTEAERSSRHSLWRYVPPATPYGGRCHVLAF